MANISVDKLASEITSMLAEYSQEVVEKVDKSSEKVGKAAVKRLKDISPKDTGDYAKSWRMKTNVYFGQPSTRIIHVAAPHYRLAHLLEFGHAKAGGGRVEGKPHIRPVEQEVIRDFTREVEEAIKST